MHHTIEFTESPLPNAVVVLRGLISVEGMTVWLHSLVGDARWRPGMRTLVDATGMELTPEFGVEQVHDVAEPVISDDDRWGRGASAVVVSDAALFGIVRQWQAYTEKMQWQTEVFYSRDDALGWLATVDTA